MSAGIGNAAWIGYIKADVGTLRRVTFPSASPLIRSLLFFSFYFNSLLLVLELDPEPTSMALSAARTRTRDQALASPMSAPVVPAGLAVSQSLCTCLCRICICIQCPIDRSTEQSPLPCHFLICPLPRIVFSSIRGVS